MFVCNSRIASSFCSLTSSSGNVSTTKAFVSVSFSSSICPESSLASTSSSVCFLEKTFFKKPIFDFFSSTVSSSMVATASSPDESIKTPSSDFISSSDFVSFDSVSLSSPASSLSVSSELLPSSCCSLFFFFSSLFSIFLRRLFVPMSTSSKSSTIMVISASLGFILRLSASSKTASSHLSSSCSGSSSKTFSAEKIL